MLPLLPVAFSVLLMRTQLPPAAVMLLGPLVLSQLAVFVGLQLLCAAPVVALAVLLIELPVACADIVALPREYRVLLLVYLMPPLDPLDVVAVLAMLPFAVVAAVEALAAFPAVLAVAVAAAVVCPVVLAALRVLSFDYLAAAVAA